MPLRSLVAALVLAAAVAAGIVFVVRDSSSSASAPLPPASGWRGLVGSAHDRVDLGQRVIVLLKAPSLADRVRAAGGVAGDGQERRWTRAVLLGQQEVLTRLAVRGVAIKPELRFMRVVNGFSAAIDASAAAVLERDPAVRGVYPVRAAFPVAVSRASVRPAQLRGGLSQMPSPLGGFSGRGVTIALLDTGVDVDAPFLHGRVLPPGFDLIGRAGGDARPRARPGSPATLERHGTEMAGILVGSISGLRTGVAPGATVLPVRVAGWQRDAAGRWSVHGRTDQLVAGLERAVDPNGDGDAHDSARIALVPLAVPFTAFSDDPLARAAGGAADLGTLVVTAAGNDGPAGPSFGAISGPGGAPATITVAAADLRARSLEAPLVVRSWLRVVLRRAVPVLGAAGPSSERSLPLVSLRALRPLRDLFDARGLSRVAGRAVLVPAGASPRAVAARAIEAGAALVLLAGPGLPAGGLGLDETAGTPVLGVPASLTALLAGAERGGGSATVSVGVARTRGGDRREGIASFSSWGLAFGGHPKPDVSAAGVGIVTGEPRSGARRASRFLTVSGSSAAAAVLAGEAAVLLEARPPLDATELQGVLVGTARSIGSEPIFAQGAGLVDLGAAATAEVGVEPATVSFGRAVGDGWSARALQVRNLSTRRLRVYLAAERSGETVIEVAPRKLVLAPGAARSVRLRARAVKLTGSQAAAGAITVAPVGGQPVRVPWAIVLAPVPRGLVGPLELSKRRFKPSGTDPAVLALRAGSVTRLSGRVQVEPVVRLDIELRNARGKPLGLLARLRDVLPGRYAFGITGRGPNGHVLRRGGYRLRVVAWPAGGGSAIRRSVRFRIE
jgi:subtilisin family serine protease